MDLNDFKNNTGGGVHSACLGGTWMAIVNGFAGFRDYESGVIFAPKIPDAWEGYRFKLIVRGTTMGITVDKDRCTFEFLSGNDLEFTLYGNPCTLGSNTPLISAELSH